MERQSIKALTRGLEVKVCVSMFSELFCGSCHVTLLSFGPMNQVRHWKSWLLVKTRQTKVQRTMCVWKLRRLLAGRICAEKKNPAPQSARGSKDCLISSRLFSSFLRGASCLKSPRRLKCQRKLATAYRIRVGL